MVTVTFAKRELAGGTNPTIYVNGYVDGHDSGYRAVNLKSKVLDAVLGAGAYNAEEYTVTMSTHLGNQNVTNSGINTHMDMEENETFYVTWNASGNAPSVTLTVTGFLTESRRAPEIIQNTHSIKVDALPDADAVKGYFFISDGNGNSVADDAALDISNLVLPDEGKSLSGGYVTVTVESNEYTLATTAEQNARKYPITIENPDYGLKINVPENDAAALGVYTDEACTTSAALNETIEGGDFWIKVTPNADTDYVDSVKVNGAAVSGVTYGDRAATVEVSLTEGATAPAEYTIEVTTGTRSISLNSEIAEVTFNANNAESDNAEFLKCIYDAAVADSAPAGIAFEACTVELKGDGIVTGEKNTFTITWNATGKYPAVSVEVEVPITELRTQVPFIGTASAKQIDLETPPTLDSLRASVESAVSGLRVPEGAAALTYTADAEDLQNVINTIRQGDTLYVTCTVASADSGLYTSNSVEVEVPVYGVIENTDVTIAVSEGGTVTLNGTAIASGTHAKAAGEYAVVADPNEGGWYWKSCSGVSEDAGDENATYTGTLSVISGKGLELGEVPAQFASIVFERRSITAKNGVSITVNGWTGSGDADYSGRLEDYQAGLTAANLLDAASGEGARNFTVQMNTGTGWKDVAELSAITNGGCLDVNTDKQIRLVWAAEGKYPAVYSNEVTVRVDESRTTPGLTGKEFPEVKVLESRDALNAYVDGLLTDRELNPNGVSVTCQLTGGAWPESAGVITQLVYTAAYKESDTYLEQTCQLTVYMQSSYPVVLDPDKDTTGTIVPGGTVEIDGVPYVLDENCTAWVPHTNARLVTAYKYHTGDTHYQTYPTNMYVWFLTGTDSDGDGEADCYSAERVEELDDFFRYEGTSVRINFGSNGIRFFTSVPAGACAALTDGELLKGSLSGYRMVRAGTLYTKWGDAGTYLNLDTGVGSDVYGGKAGDRFRVFSKVGSQDWYTGVLTGLDGDTETLGMDILSRPFVTLERDGEQITLYGGTVQRSIYYVVVQNRDRWAAGTAYDNFIENIIETVESAGGAT